MRSRSLIINGSFRLKHPHHLYPHAHSHLLEVAPWRIGRGCSWSDWRALVRPTLHLAKTVEFTTTLVLEHAGPCLETVVGVGVVCPESSLDER